MEHECGDGYRDDESEDGSLNQYPNSTDFQGDESGNPEGNDLSWLQSSNPCNGDLDSSQADSLSYQYLSNPEGDEDHSRAFSPENGQPYNDPLETQYFPPPQRHQQYPAQAQHGGDQASPVYAGEDHDNVLSVGNVLADIGVHFVDHVVERVGQSIDKGGRALEHHTDRGIAVLENGIVNIANSLLHVKSRGHQAHQQGHGKQHPRGWGGRG